jgi:hypothetical protein
MLPISCAREIGNGRVETAGTAQYCTGSIRNEPVACMVTLTVLAQLEHTTGRFRTTAKPAAVNVGLQDF